MMGNWIGSSMDANLKKQQDFMTEMNQVINEQRLPLDYIFV